MNEKRRDNRGRILRNGEMQLQNGRYRYKYTDAFGGTKYVYSWRLDRNDRTPTGKKKELSLREKEQQIAADMFDQIVPDGGKLTVSALVKKYVSLKTGVCTSTKKGYQAVINFLEKDNFGKLRIDKVKISDAKAWLIQLQNNGKGFNSIRNIRGILRPAFQLAVDDDIIRKNPFMFELATIVYDDSKTRDALSHENERKFLKFVKEDSHFSRYYDAIYILFNTGLRISEFCGLTIKDIDFDNMKITVDHQLQRHSGTGYEVTDPKSDCGTRYVPMTVEVAECFKRIFKAKQTPKVEPIINGYGGFIFLDKNGNPTVALHWEKYFHHICDKYNKIYMVQMPKVTPHVCRHTYCSRLVAARKNPKAVQYIMGHSDVSITLNTYTHLTFDEVVEDIIGTPNKKSNIIKLK